MFFFGWHSWDLKFEAITAEDYKSYPKLKESAMKARDICEVIGDKEAHGICDTIANQVSNFNRAILN